MTSGVGVRLGIVRLFREISSGVWPVRLKARRHHLRGAHRTELPGCLFETAGTNPGWTSRGIAVSPRLRQDRKILRPFGFGVTRADFAPVPHGDGLHGRLGKGGRPIGRTGGSRSAPHAVRRRETITAPSGVETGSLRVMAAADPRSTACSADLGKDVDRLPAQAMTVWVGQSPNGAAIVTGRPISGDPDTEPTAGPLPAPGVGTLWFPPATERESSRCRHPSPSMASRPATR